MTKSVNWRLILLGFLFLIFSAYVDNLRGILLPVFSQVFSLTHQQNSSFLVVGNFASVLFTLSLIFLARHFSDRAICVWLSVASIATLLSATQVSGYGGLLALSILFGGLISIAGSMSNLQVIHGSSVQDRAKFMCGLHTMYGIGSLCAPEVAKRLFASGYSWVATVLAVLPVGVLLLLGSLGMPERSPEPKAEGQVLRVHPLQGLILVIFAVYVAGEVMTSMWMASYLVEFKSLSIVEAAPFVAGFFFMMAATRVTCFFSLQPRLERVVLVLSIVGAASFFVLAYRGHLWAFPLVGVLGPFFPLFLSRLGKTFPQSVRSLTLWILASNQLTQACFHFVVGGIADRLGIRAAYGLPLILLVCCLSLLIWYLRMEKKYETMREI